MAAPAAASAPESSSTASSSDGPVLSFMNKRLRNLKKKYNRVIQLEESLAQGKPMNKEQEELLRSKYSLSILIDEYEKLRQPLASALQEELSLFSQTNQRSLQVPSDSSNFDEVVSAAGASGSDAAIEDLLNLVYFGSLFDVKPQSEFTSTMLTRIHERECCLTYDYVTDDATDLLGEKDFDVISLLGSLVIARPAHSSLSHKNALRSCVQHAKLWLAKSDQPIQPGISVNYSELRERLNKILASDYFTTTPEMKAPVDVAAAAGKYASSQVPVQEPSMLTQEVQAEDALAGQFEQKDEDTASFDGKEVIPDQPNSMEEVYMEEVYKEDVEVLNPTDVPAHQDHSRLQADVEEQPERGVADTEQQHIPRRGYQNQRGGGRGGRRGYPNGRGGRGGRGGSNHQNGRSQYYESGNYYPRNYYNTRGRGGGRSSGATVTYDNHGAAARGGHGHDDAEDEFGR